MLKAITRDVSQSVRIVAGKGGRIAENVEIRNGGRLYKRADAYGGNDVTQRGADILGIDRIRGVAEIAIVRHRIGELADPVERQLVQIETDVPMCRRFS